VLPAAIVPKGISDMYDPDQASLYAGPRRERAPVGLVLAFAVIVLVACAVIGFAIVQVRSRVASTATPSPASVVRASGVGSPG
jgi:hypothetical protein